MKKSIGSKAIAFPTPVFIIGTYGEDGKPNAMNVAWGGICGSNPPCVAISVRKQRHTYDNIMRRKAFTVNIPSEEYVKEADYFGIASGKDADKLKETGLTPVKSEHVDAPYIEEFPFVLECKVINEVEIGEHIQFIGEIIDIKVDQDCLGKDDVPDIDSIKPMMFDPATYRYRNIGGDAGQAFSIGKVYDVHTHQ